MIFNGNADAIIKITPSVNYKEIIYKLAYAFISEIKLLKKLVYFKCRRLTCKKIHFVICHQQYNYRFNNPKVWLTSKIFWNYDKDKLTKNLQEIIFLSMQWCLILFRTFLCYRINYLIPNMASNNSVFYCSDSPNDKMKKDNWRWTMPTTKNFC